MKQYQIERIKDLMESKGVTLKELASKCGVSEMTVRRILTAKHNPTTDTVEKIAEALGVHEHYIYEPEGEAQSKVPINGYIEYGDTILKVRTFKQLEKIYNDIKNDLGAPKQAKLLIDQDKANQKTQSKQPIDITAIDLFKREQYDTSKLYTWSFRKSDDEKEEMLNDLGNMCQGYPFKVFGEKFLNSECAYISGMFSQNTPKAIEIQKKLQKCDNGYGAKKEIRRMYEQVGLSRDDWNSFNVQWMLFVCWCKVTQNKKFAEKLRKIPSYAMIVENSTFQKAQKGKDTAAFWGMRNQAIKEATQTLESAAEVQNHSASKKDIEKAKMAARNSVNHVGIWEGVNCMGKILTICKHCLDDGTEPPIDYDILRSKQIYLFGKLLTFDDKPEPPKPVRRRKDATVKVQPTKSPTVTKGKYKAIIFDFDGTLVDTKPLDQYHYLLKGKERLTPEWAEALKEYNSHLKDCKPYDGIDEVLQYLKKNGIDAYIVTGSNTDKVKEAIKLYGWKGLFKDIISRYAIRQWQIRNKSNNNPILFKKALYDNELEAIDCISIGNEIVDTKAARKCGIMAYNAYYGAVPEEREEMDRTLKDLNVYDPREIIKILQSEPKEVTLSEDEQLELLSESVIPNKGIMGAICGDILGSMYERKPKKNIPLDKRLKHSAKMQYTDDTVQTLAVAQWLMTDPDHSKETLIKLMKRYGKTYKIKWAGEWFSKWLESEDNKPDDSEDDGAAMRVSSVAYYAKTLEECLELAKITAEVSHNTKEGIDGAQASAAAVFMYLHGSSKDEIKDYVSKTFDYDLNRNTKDIRPTYKLETLCSKVVPEAIICFLEGETYEDVIKLAISLGGDADTQGAISGAIAAAQMPIPQVEADICYESLPTELKKVITDFYAMLDGGET